MYITHTASHLAFICTAQIQTYACRHRHICTHLHVVISQTLSSKVTYTHMREHTLVTYCIISRRDVCGDRKCERWRDMDTLEARVRWSRRMREDGGQNTTLACCGGLSVDLLLSSLSWRLVIGPLDYRLLFISALIERMVLAGPRHALGWNV